MFILAKKSITYMGTKQAAAIAKSTGNQCLHLMVNLLEWVKLENIIAYY
jgi:hypothetical protein